MRSPFFDSSICEKTAMDGYGLSNDTKISPQLHPFPLFGGRKCGNKREKWNFPFSNDKTAGGVARLLPEEKNCKVFPINNFQQQRC